MEEMVEVTAERAVYPRPTLPTSVTILNNKSPTSSSSQEPPSSDQEPAAPLPPKKQSLMSEIAVRMQWFYIFGCIIPVFLEFGFREAKMIGRTI